VTPHGSGLQFPCCWMGRRVARGCISRPGPIDCRIFGRLESSRCSSTRPSSLRHILDPPFHTYTHDARACLTASPPRWPQADVTTLLPLIDRDAKARVAYGRRNESARPGIAENARDRNECAKRDGRSGRFSVRMLRPRSATTGTGVAAQVRRAAAAKAESAQTRKAGSTRAIEVARMRRRGRREGAATARKNADARREQKTKHSLRLQARARGGYSRLQFVKGLAFARRGRLRAR